MKIRLHGTDYFLDIHHGNNKISLRGKEIECKSTTVTLAPADNPKKVVFAGTSYCLPTDQFCKQEGRKRAVKKLLANMRESHKISIKQAKTRQAELVEEFKDQRALIFESICPEYA